MGIVLYSGIYLDYHRCLLKCKPNTSLSFLQISMRYSFLVQHHNLLVCSGSYESKKFEMTAFYRPAALATINQMTCIHFNPAVLWTHFKLQSTAHKVESIMATGPTKLQCSMLEDILQDSLFVASTPQSITLCTQQK